jgi:hypothetical protein
LDEVKRKLIIREIDHWRRSKLLPEHYCDFLTNLYMEDESDRQTGVFGLSSGNISNSGWKTWLALFASFAAISYSALNFNSFPLAAQIGLSFIVLLVCYLFGYSQLEKQKLLSYVLFGIASLFLLGVGLHLLRLYHLDDNPFIILVFVVFCSLAWLFTGVASRITLFHLCGWCGLVLCYGWILTKYTDLTSWMEMEMGWLPFSVIFVWIGWLCQHRNKRLTVLFFLLALTTWFSPEFFAVAMHSPLAAGMQISLLGKMILAGLILFVSRKRWTEWVV